MEQDLINLGAGGLLALLIVREVLAFLRTKTPNKEATRMVKQIAELHEWHNKTDVDGERSYQCSAR